MTNPVTISISSEHVLSTLSLLEYIPSGVVKETINKKVYLKYSFIDILPYWLVNV